MDRAQKRKIEELSAAADAEIAAFTAKAASPRASADLDSLSSFQKQLSAYPQLSPEGQLEMVRRVRQGREAEDLLTPVSYTHLTLPTNREV